LAVASPRILRSPEPRQNVAGIQVGMGGGAQAAGPIIDTSDEQIRTKVGWIAEGGLAKRS
jgi:hypothetical protein